MGMIYGFYTDTLLSTSELLSFQKKPVLGGNVAPRMPNSDLIISRVPKRSPTL